MGEEIREESGRDPVRRGEEKSREQSLIEAAQNGDQKAFGQLIRLHQKRLFRYIYAMLGSFDAAEDVVQEAFVKAYENLKRFKTGYDFYPWLSTIARNTAYNYLRGQEKSESLDALAEKGYNPETAELGPLEKLLEGESKRRFYKALKALPAQYRAAFVLRHFEDMNYADIASYLKIPPGTVDSRLYRARQLLLEELKDLL
jgi:RNA polymerase sigma-70 factor (ECF subfamily)